MFSKNFIRKSLSVLTALAVWSLYSMVVLAATSGAKNSGELIASGQVTVNGQPVTSNTTIVSGSTITTGDNSTAIINLGKIGKLEVSQTAVLTINFDDSNMSLNLDSGRTKVMSVQGITAKVTTKDGVVNATAGQINNFAVTVECSFTNVENQNGVVSLASGNGNKLVAAGTEASLGVQQTGCKPCLRPVPGGGTVPTAGLGGIGGAVGTAVVVGTSGGNSDVSTGAGTVVVSLTR